MLIKYYINIENIYVCSNCEHFNFIHPFSSDHHLPQESWFYKTWHTLGMREKHVNIVGFLWKICKNKIYQSTIGTHEHLSFTSTPFRPEYRTKSVIYWQSMNFCFLVLYLHSSNRFMSSVISSSDIDNVSFDWLLSSNPGCEWTSEGCFWEQVKIRTQ